MLSKTLRAILEASAEATGSERPSISLLCEVWPTLVGEPICHRTRPLRWEEMALVVGVASDGWLSEMRTNGGRLVRRVRARLPWRVDRLDFEVCDLPDAAPAKSDGQGTDDAAQSPPSVDEFDGPLREELERLDADTRKLALRIARHVSGEG